MKGLHIVRKFPLTRKFWERVLQRVSVSIRAVSAISFSFSFEANKMLEYV